MDALNHTHDFDEERIFVAGCPRCEYFAKEGAVARGIEDLDPHSFLGLNVKSDPRLALMWDQAPAELKAKIMAERSPVIASAPPIPMAAIWALMDRVFMQGVEAGQSIARKQKTLAQQKYRTGRSEVAKEIERLDNARRMRGKRSEARMWKAIPRDATVEQAQAIAKEHGYVLSRWRGETISSQ